MQGADNFSQRTVLPGMNCLAMFLQTQPSKKLSSRHPFNVGPLLVGEVVKARMFEESVDWHSRQARLRLFLLAIAINHYFPLSLSSFNGCAFGLLPFTPVTAGQLRGFCNIYDAIQSWPGVSLSFFLNSLLTLFFVCRFNTATSSRLHHLHSQSGANQVVPAPCKTDT